MANKLLKESLALAGYFEIAHTPGLWWHVSRPVAFSLAVDDFGVNYVGRENAENLATTITKHYPLRKDWDGGLYLGINLKWNYDERLVDCSMTNYVLKGLQKFRHSPPEKKPSLPLSHSSQKICSSCPRTQNP